jgi:hypothetical protein
MDPTPEHKATRRRLRRAVDMVEIILVEELVIGNDGSLPSFALPQSESAPKDIRQESFHDAGQSDE